MAPKTGVARCAEAFTAASGHRVALSFATAPVLRQRVEAGEAADIVIAPLPTMTGFRERGLTVAGVGTVIGSVKAGVAVRDGQPGPDLASPEAFVAALHAADSWSTTKPPAGATSISCFSAWAWPRRSRPRPPACRPARRSCATWPRAAGRARSASAS